MYSALKAYESLEQYYRDLLKYVDIKLSEYYEATIEDHASPSLGWQLKQYTASANARSVEAQAHLDQMEKRVAETLPTALFIPLEHLLETFKLTKFETFCIYLSVAVELDPSFEKNIRFFNETLNSAYPTLGLALKIYCKNSTEFLKERMHLNRQCNLFKFFLINSLSSHEALPLVSVPMKLDMSIVDFIINFNQYQISDAFMSIIMPNSKDSEHQFDQIEQNLHEFVKINFSEALNKNVMFYLHGPLGIGKHELIYHFCNQYDQTILCIDCKKLNQNSAEVQQFTREAILHRATVVFENFEILIDSPTDKKTSLFLETLLESLSKFAKMSFALSNVPWYNQVEFNQFSIIEIELEIPNALERLSVWADKGKTLKIDAQVDLTELSNKFKFTPKQITKAYQDASNEMLWKHVDAIDSKMLHKASYNQLSHNLKDKAQLIISHYGWQDIVLPTEQFDLLKEACDHVRYQHIVFNKWGFNAKITYGTGLGLLFTGPPGTGKTLAAQVIANELNLEIYRVDLSQIISKYIGETEKNLKMIFDEAAQSGAILLFDEGDALFSKRTDVSDSHDKYANVETSYLLQKIEAYEGISIVTTNLLGNIDDAFIRRFSFVVHFPFPTAEYRRQIWRSIFPVETPLSETIDLDYLANNFEFSGGNIKNIALNASFKAASKDRPVSMKDLLLSVASEISKTGKVVLASDFGEYAYLLTT
ncbi:ATP-binding protein [Fusibacter sp. 3D3]|uniref:ATP-binding protein n=1 Tax=Fusibacter sp. 3D3 TaxID=1048380 RepID=UPI00085343BE|nr:ATP-binding protein [Fusibacter sp. 3D3]GAU77499.1 cell division protein FtsH [Fusibacter sp. 3D3]